MFQGENIIREIYTSDVILIDEEIEMMRNVDDSYFDLMEEFISRIYEHQLILTYKKSHIQQNGKIKYLLDKEYFHCVDYKNLICPDFRLKELNFKY